MDVRRHILVVLLPTILAIILGVSAIYLIRENDSAHENIEIHSASRVMERVFHNLDSDPILEVI